MRRFWLLQIISTPQRVEPIWMGLKMESRRIINDYARSHNMLKEKEDNMSGEDVRSV